MRKKKVSLKINNNNYNKTDSQKLAQFEQSKINPQKQQNKDVENKLVKKSHKTNVLLIIIVVLFCIALLFVFYQRAAYRESLSQNNAQADSYKELVINNSTQEKVKAIVDVPPASKEEKNLSEMQVVQQKELLEEKQQKKPLDEGLSTEFDQYFVGDCKDSDGGKNYYEAGTTVSKVGIANNDYCDYDLRFHQNTLHEFSCGTIQMEVKTSFECPHGCKDGACVQS